MVRGGLEVLYKHARIGAPRQGRIYFCGKKTIFVNSRGGSNDVNEIWHEMGIVQSTCYLPKIQKIAYIKRSCHADL